MPTLTQGDIQIESAVPITDIQDLHMKIQGNAHAYIRMEGLVPDKEGEKCLLRPLEGSGLTVRIDERILFTGMLREAQIVQEGLGYHVSLIGVSNTERLDYQKKCRTFQDTSMTYKEVMQQVLADMPGAEICFHVEDVKIGTPLYQMEETDWAFIKRLAGGLNTGMITCAYSMAPDIHIGIPKGERHKADDKAVSERIWYDRKCRSLCMSVRTGDNWEIGDKIGWENRELTVVGKECRLERGLLHFYYTLMERERLEADTYENSYMIGLLLSATVLDVKEEQIKVKFDVDREQPLESAYWYPWEPDMGNLAYCMPEKGERVYIQIGDAVGDEVRAVCGVHRNGSGHPEMQNSHRYFTTKDRKRMYLTPDAIGFQDMGQKKILQTELKDGTGASLVSHRNFTIMAEENVGLRGNNILIQAPQEISLVKKSLAPTVLNMCNGFDLIGAADKVVMEGSSEEEFPVFHNEEQGQGKYVFKEPEKMTACIVGSTPAEELEDSLEYILEGCQVKQLERSSLI